MSLLRFYIDPASIPQAPVNDEIAVWLYGSGTPFGHAGSIAPDLMDKAARFKLRPSAAAIDLVSIAMAVTAADAFVSRLESPNGWARSFALVVPLADSARWGPLADKLQKTLRFLSGDNWSFEFQPGGAPPPSLEIVRSRQKVFDLSKVDCVSLFSGGLDSATGAIDLIASGRRPLLVSHASQGDASYQEAVASFLPGSCSRLEVNSYPRRNGPSETSTRTRSFLFLAVAALAADLISQFRGDRVIDLFICENGLIALNPPLTPRRIGPWSTRTAHPHFLASVRELLQVAGLRVNLVNPYRHRSKGEMLSALRAQPHVRALVAQTVSCGKWKRAS